MLRREMVRHASVIYDRQPDQSLFTRPWQRGVCRQKQRKTSCRYENRQRDKPDRLFAQERSVSFRAIREVSARQPVPDPKQSGQTEVKQIEWTRLRIRIPAREQ